MKTIALLEIGAIFLFGSLSPIVLEIINTILLITICSILIYSIVPNRNVSKPLTSQEIIFPSTELSTYEMGISKETKNELFRKIISFEESKAFLEKNLTLTKVASQLNTNTKYLSYIIKLHSDRDFNNYINLLRVQYIVNQLEENPKLHHYKISALADEAGFSSHSKFAHFFKLNLGVTPSKFIADLKEYSAS